MSHTIILKEIEPTVFLRHGPSGLEQLVRLKVRNDTPRAEACVVEVRAGSGSWQFPLGEVVPGESTHEIFLDEITSPCEAEFALKARGRLCDRKSMQWTAPRHWVVHVVQHGHHDVGYTNLASNVLREHDAWLDRVIDMAQVTADFPDDAQFRMAVEQTWSIDHYLKNAPPERAGEMIRLLRSGHVEVTALFGNMTTELCGHEILTRTTHHAFRLKLEHGIPIVSAYHDDVLGMSWGLCTVLAEAGVKILCAGIPGYFYSWGDMNLQSSWDAEAVFGSDLPGAFWWEAPSGQRVLCWCDNSFGWGGDCRASLPGLPERLRQLEEEDYQYTVLRWPVLGGGRDNSPYIEGYAHTIHQWNQKWACPHLVCSTNTRFYHDFVKEVPADLPVFRGELPGQDYIVGAMSTAEATAVNRNNHATLGTAEMLSVFASAVTDCVELKPEVDDACEGILWHDEHTWGSSFPCGPTSRTAQLEKAVHAHRAAALIHDVTSKALARIADHVKTDGEGFHLVVFNPLPHARDGLVRMPLQEMSNCGSTMAPVPPEEDPEGEGYLRGVPLQDRGYAAPEPEIVNGNFELVDVCTGQTVPFQIVEVDAADATVAFAAERLGIGSGSKQYGAVGLKRDLVFVAGDVPPCGYRTYRLKPHEKPSQFPAPFQATGQSIENEFYRLSFDCETGRIVSIQDKQAGRELLDAGAPHSLGDVLVRDPGAMEPTPFEALKVQHGVQGPICASIERIGRAHGHPAVRETFTLYAGVKRIDVALRVLKDPTPLLDVHLAFPLAAEPPRFRYEGALSAMDPIRDYLPGAYSDAIAVQNWVKVGDGRFSILWSSLDAPTVSMGGLWPGYVSPAHACVIGSRLSHPPLKLEDLKKGWVYSTLFCNNFGTNFSVSQSGDFLFRYSLTSCTGDAADHEAARFGWGAVTPLETIFTEHARSGTLAACNSFLEVETPEVALLACKRAERGGGYVFRLWNRAAREVHACVHCRFAEIKEVSRVNLFEERTGETVTLEDGRMRLPLPAGSVVTLKAEIQTA